MAIPLVVGIDGSEASLEAVEWAADEAVRHEVPLHLVHAAVPNHEAPNLIAAASERARRSAPAVRLSSEVLHEDAASALAGKGRNAFA
ncbi:universal stress protein, partial [Streptomyces lunaelactis]|uniref:universal stress protein n=1 Tax=Streptomyces lunaelactis TaxID=1535768 RepID=UPI001584DFE2